MENFLSHK